MDRSNNNFKIINLKLSCLTTKNIHYGEKKEEEEDT
jgi:hypothetical protein